MSFWHLSCAIGLRVAGKVETAVAKEEDESPVDYWKKVLIACWCMHAADPLTGQTTQRAKSMEIIFSLFIFFSVKLTTVCVRVSAYNCTSSFCGICDSAVRVRCNLCCTHSLQNQPCCVILLHAISFSRYHCQATAIIYADRYKHR